MKRDLLISKYNSNDESVKVIEWLVDDISYVNAGQSIVLVETSKTNIEIECTHAGHILKKCKADDILQVGSCFASIFERVEDIEHYRHMQTEPISLKLSNEIENSLHNFSKAALKYIDEHNLDPSVFSDIELVTVEKIKARLREKSGASLPFNLQTFSEAKIEPLPFSKLSEINALSKGKDGALTSSLTVQLDTEEIRKYFSPVSWLNRSILPYILSIFSRLLAENPCFTSFYYDKQLYLYNKVNIGLAIDLGKGLKVVIMEDADKLSLFDTQMAIIDCIANYHEPELQASTIKYSTVTVTDLSQYNILHFQPLLNANQSVILGIGGDQSLPGSPLSLTIVFDHRVLSGQQIAIFLSQFKERMLTEFLSFTLDAASF